MTAFFSTFFRSQLFANASLLDPGNIGIVLFRQAPSFSANDARYTGASVLSELLALPGWVETTAIGYPIATGYPVVVSTRTAGASRYIMINEFPLTGMDPAEVVAVGFYYSGSVGGKTNPLIMVSNTPFPTKIVIKDGDSITALPDTTLTGSNRWLLNWAVPGTGATTVNLSEGPLALAKGPPAFETSHTQHVWLYPERCNYIANPSFEAPGTNFWSTNGAITRVADPSPQGGAWAGYFTFGGFGAVIAESNKFLTDHEEYWTIQLMAKGNGNLKVGLVYWRDEYDETMVDWGDETWPLSPDAYSHIAVCRMPVQTYEAMVRIECSGTQMSLDRVLCEKGFLKDWMYFDGDTTYGARDDFSWYGGATRQGASYSLWYNNKNAIFGRLFHRNINVDDATLVTDQDVILENGLVYRWVPAGINVTPHIDVLYPEDTQAPLPPKPAGVLAYKTDDTDLGGVINPWPSGTFSPIATGSPTLAPLVAAATGQSLTPVAGTSARTLAPLVASGSGSVVQTQLFSATGAAQTWVVPAGVTSVTVDMAGASGGNYTPALGGKGGRVQCVLPATPGASWQLNVGKTGITAPNLAYATSFPGGGGFGNSAFGGGGGGESDIRIGGTALANRKVVAGGGGGCGNNVETTPGNGVAGGAGGGLTGGDGSGTAGYVGHGGTQAAKGANGPNASHDAVQNDGGRGPNFGDNQGGGGGGGYWGGGGGGCEPSTSNGAGGGGGGSSFADAIATSVVHTQGYQTGDGYIRLTW